MSILIAVLGFSLLIVVHELGHYLIARATGMRVERFSVGFGPPVVQVERGGTVYQVAAFPVGGYVAVAGMGATQEDHAPGSYLSRPLWARAAMVAAGPVFNFGFAALVYFYLFDSHTAVSYEWHREATHVVRESSGAAAAAGIRAGDAIESINGEAIANFRDLKAATGKHGGAPMTVVVARPPEGESSTPEPRPTLVEGLVFTAPAPTAAWTRLTLTVTPEKTEAGFLLGVSPVFGRFGAADTATAARFAVSETWAVLSAIGAP